MKKSHFTLVEIMVVITIIALLVGLSFKHIKEAIITSRQQESAENLRQLAAGIINRHIHSKGVYYKMPYDDELGIRTLNAEEALEGDLFIGGEIVVTTDPNFKGWATWSGNHPVDPENGFYVFHAIESSGNLKKRMDPDSRIAMEVFDWTNEGLGRTSVVFGDGHVRVLNVSTPFGEFDELAIIEALSVKGENNGEL